MTYADRLRDPRWQKLRLQILERAAWKCESCEDSTQTLHVHHLIYSGGDPWDAPIDTLEALCKDCHTWREEFNRFFAGRSLVSTSYFQWIIRILDEGFTKPLPDIAFTFENRGIPASPTTFFKSCLAARMAYLKSSRTAKPASEAVTPKTPTVMEQPSSSNRTSKAPAPLDTANMLQSHQPRPANSVPSEIGNPPHQEAVNTLCSTV